MRQNDEKKMMDPIVWLVVLQSEVMNVAPSFAEARAFQKGLRFPETLVFRAQVVCEGDGSEPLLLQKG